MKARNLDFGISVAYRETESAMVRGPLEGTGLRNAFTKSILGNLSLCRAVLLLLLLSCPALSSADPWMSADYFKARVVIPKNASPTLLAAAQDFTRYWQLSTGEAIEFGTEQEGPVLIWLGPELMPESMVSKEALEGLGEQGFIIRSYTPNRRDVLYMVGSHLYISGKNDEATRDGVLEYFHRFLRARWYAPGETQAVFVENAGVPEASLTYIPPFRFREVGYFGMWPKEKGMGEFRIAQHLPAEFQPSPRASAGLAVPPAEGGAVQLEDKALGGKVAAWIRDSAKTGQGDLPLGVRTRIWRDAGGRDVEAWTLNRIPMLDPALDQWLLQDAGAPGKVLALAGTVVEELRQADATSGTHVQVLLPPDAPLPPTDMTLDARIIINLSNAACDFSRPILNAHCAENRAFLAALEAWSKTGATLFVSDQVASMRNNIAPFPNFDVLRANLYAYTQYGVSGVYAEAWDFPEVKQAEFDRLRAYLVSSLLWNPDQVAGDLREGFLTRYYGPATPQVREFLDAFEQAVRNSGKPLKADGLPDWLTPDAVATADAALGSALKLELESKYKPRASALLSTLEYAQLLCPPGLETAADGTKLWRRPKSRSLEQIIERLNSRGLGQASSRLNLVERLTQDAGGTTPPREQPYVEGQAPK